MKLGFIGLGRMGVAMAANLVEAGHEVSVFNRSAGKSGPLIELGAREAADLAGACSGEVVVTMLADDDAVSDIALRPGGLTVVYVSTRPGRPDAFRYRFSSRRS